MPRGQEPNAKQVIADLRSIFRGVVKQYDPGALLAGELQDAQNARLVNGNLISRGGQSRVNGTVVTGTPVAIFDDWTGDGPVYPVYGGFQATSSWIGSDTEPLYYQVYYDFVGLSVTVTLIPRDASILYNDFYITSHQAVKVGDYWYIIFQQIPGETYNGIAWARQFHVARATPGTSWQLVDFFTIGRQDVSGSASHWSDYSITHDGDRFVAALRAGGGSIYTSTYETQVIGLTLDGSTNVSRIGNLRGDLNTAITSAGGTAIAAGSSSPPFSVVYYGGYLLAYPRNCPSSHLTEVGGTKPGYAGYIAKAGSTWGLINAATSPVADGAVGRCRWHQIHDGKVYLLTATNYDSLGDCVMRVWDPVTNPAVVTSVFTLSGGRRWLWTTAAGSGGHGGNAVSYQGKLYFSWSTGTEIGVGSWDGTTLDEDVWSTTWSAGGNPVWLMPMRDGLAVIVLAASFSPDRQMIFYSNGVDLSSWSSISVEGVTNPLRIVIPEEL